MSDNTTEIVIDGNELMAEMKKDMLKGKPAPRKQILRVMFEVGVPREGGGFDVITSENTLGITTDSLPSKIIAKIKPQLIDTLNKARDHVPNPLLTPKTDKPE